MHQLLSYPPQLHFRVGSLTEKTSFARLRLEEVYNLRLEYANYTTMGPVFAFSGRTPFQEFAARNPPARVGVVARDKLFTSLPFLDIAPPTDNCTRPRLASLWLR